jgi:uroporphyrinogen-III synthase
MTVLITRAAEEAERLGQLLAARGIDSLIEPLMTIRFLPHGAATLAPFLSDVQAVLFTSANGVRAFAAATERRDLKAFAVGDATAAAARVAGFGAVTSARGNVEDLAALVIGSLRPSNGALVHAAGSVTAGDLAGLLGAAGFALRRAVLYEAIVAERLSEPTRDALIRGAVAAALFYSPRNATTFVRLATGLEAACRRVAAIALSSAVASALKPLPWRHIAVAAAPHEASLLRSLEESLHREETR